MAYTNKWIVRFEVENIDVGEMHIRDAWLSIEIVAESGSQAINESIAALRSFGPPLSDVMTMTLLERVEEP